MAKKHDIMWLDTVDSTNEEARRRISSLDNLSVLSASRQTEGRGQRGNSWESECGKNLTFSTVLYPTELKAKQQFCLSMIVAFAIVDALNHYTKGFSIKWPNDIYWENKKIAGIFLGLMLFVAVPLPTTGAWTGSLVAALFDLPKKHSFLAILLGVMISGVIMCLASYGTVGFLKFLLPN